MKIAVTIILVSLFSVVFSLSSTKTYSDREQLAVVKSIFSTRKDSKVLIESRDESGLAYLHHAANLGNIETVEYLLLTVKADKNKQTSFRDTPLHYSARGGHDVVTRALIEAGAWVNSQNVVLWTPLHKAVHYQRLSTVRYLIKSGADLNIKKNDGRTALMSASGSLNKELLKVLIKGGADLNRVDNKGNTALLIAFSANQFENIKILVEAGANLEIADKNGYTILHHISTLGRLDLTKLLVEAGANVDMKAGSSWHAYAPSALDLAVTHGKTSVAKYLKEVVDSRSQGYATYLYTTIFGDSRKITSEQNEAKKFRSTKLSVEEETFLSEIEELSFTNLSSIFDANGRTKAHWAAFCGYTEVTKYLFTKGVNFDVQDGNGWTPLHYASRFNHDKVIELLVNAKVDLNTQNSNGFTALHYASRNGNMNNVRYLVESGARIGIQETTSSYWFGDTPLSIAEDKKYHKIVKYLKSRPSGNIFAVLYRCAVYFIQCTVELLQWCCILLLSYALLLFSFLKDFATVIALIVVVAASLLIQCTVKILQWCCILVMSCALLLFSFLKDFATVIALIVVAAASLHCLYKRNQNVQQLPAPVPAVAPHQRQAPIPVQVQPVAGQRQASVIEAARQRREQEAFENRLEKLAENRRRQQVQEAQFSERSAAMAAQQQLDIEDIPDECICPITFEVMKDPVVCSDGHTYERKAISNWLSTHNTSPKTNEPLRNKDLVPNHSLRQMIERYDLK